MVDDSEARESGAEGACSEVVVGMHLAVAKVSSFTLI